jgi:hypothetical protein
VQAKIGVRASKNRRACKQKSACVQAKIGVRASTHPTYYVASGAAAAA